MIKKNRSSLSILFASLALILAAQISAFSQEANNTKVNIKNFGQMDERFFRGAQPSGRDYADLAALGVKTVIDLQEYGENDERAMVEKSGMQYVNIKMTTRIVPTDEQIEQFLSIVNDPAKQPVYVHCAGGRHRTGVMTAIYRMAEEGWTSERAFKEMKQYRFGADYLHPEFKKFVYAYRPLTPQTETQTILATTIVPPVNSQTR